MKKYEVTVSVTMHGTFTVKAESEQEAEDAVGRRFNSGDIKLADLDEMDSCRVDCVGEVE